MKPSAPPHIKIEPAKTSGDLGWLCMRVQSHLVRNVNTSHITENVIRIFQHSLKELRNTRLVLLKLPGRAPRSEERVAGDALLSRFGKKLDIHPINQPVSRGEMRELWNRSQNAALHAKMRCCNAMMESSFRDPSFSGGGRQAENRAFSCLIGPPGSQSISQVLRGQKSHIFGGHRCKNRCANSSERKIGRTLSVSRKFWQIAWTLMESRLLALLCSIAYLYTVMFTGMVVCGLTCQSVCYLHTDWPLL